MLSNIISTQRFELIRDAIGRVLTAELANQVTLNEAEDELGIAVNIYLERTCPLDKEELPAINIVYSDTDFTDETTSVTSRGDNKYLIECYVNSASDATDSGDKKAAILLSKIMGMVRAILMNNRNLYLDFTEKFIQTRRIKTITRTKPRITNDAENIISGLLEAHYFAEEDTELQTAEIGTLLDTVVKLHDTDKGYKYEIVNT